MPEGPLGRATVRFWAGARRAAGQAEQPTDATSIAEVRAELSKRPELAAIVEASAFLVDGVQAGDLTVIGAGSVVDVLPPFAGG